VKPGTDFGCEGPGQLVVPAATESSPGGSPTDAGAAGEETLPDALERLYSEHFDFVWRSLRRLGIDTQHIDDAVQDVFIVSLRRRHEFRGQSSDRTWLYGIATNVSHEYRRKARRAAHTTPMTDEHTAHGPSPLEQASSSQSLRLIDTLLASLDEPKRHVFILAELEQMSAPEIASALGIKPNTVYSRLRAARQAFFDLLRREVLPDHD
jgi:RNA polymerase sigma-70 factor, ECF subfamily